MPVYNAAPYLRDAMDSVLAQTYTDFEFLIINDGSTDESPDILAQYNDPRIKVIHQENIKLIDTLNKGLQVAKGDWIARFDADDICNPDRLIEQVNFLKQNPECIIVGSEAEYMDKDGNYLFTQKCKGYNDDELRKIEFTSCPFIHSAVIYNKAAVLKVGAYDRGAITFEDHLLWCKLSKVGEMANITKPLIKVRFNPESVTIDEKWRGKDFIDIKYKIIKEGKVSDADAEMLKEILSRQNIKTYKEAAYYSMIAKKYLWNQYNPAKARENLFQAIKYMPFKKEPYLLYLLSFFPERIIKAIYNRV
jgi:glycosyltransferase involved in cell wall biosynthesis